MNVHPYLLPWTEGGQRCGYGAQQPYGHGQHGCGQRRTRSTAAWCTAWGECNLVHYSKNKQTLPSMAEASLRSLWEEASTMFLTWKRLMALSYANYTTSLTTYLAHAAEAVSASDGGHMTSTLLGTSMVSTFPLIVKLNTNHIQNCSSDRANTYLRLKGMVD